MGCNCGRNKKKKKASSPQQIENKVETAMSDKEIDAIANLMMNRVKLQDAIEEVGVKGSINDIRNKVLKKLGKERMQIIRFLDKFEHMSNRICLTEDVDLINAVIANCEDLLIRLKQKKAELT